jgi:hypothetical protein
MEDISVHYSKNESLGEFIEFLGWFLIASTGYPNEKINEKNLDVYYNHMFKCIDRFVKDARSATVMREKIQESFDKMRAGDRRNAMYPLQVASWVIECPEEVEELKQSDH